MPVSSPSYFPPSRANGTVVGITAGVNTTGAQSFLAGNQAGESSTSSGLIIIGYDAGNAGITGQDNAVIIGVGAATSLYGNSNQAPNDAPIIIGYNAAQNTSSADGSVIIGSNTFGSVTALTGANPEGIQTSVILGSEIANSSVTATSGYCQNSVVIGYDISSANSPAFDGFSSSVIIGSHIGLTASSSFESAVVIGYEACSKGVAPYSVLIGSNCAPNVTGATTQYLIAIGNNAAPNIVNYGSSIYIGNNAGIEWPDAPNQIVLIGEAVSGSYESYIGAKGVPGQPDYANIALGATTYANSNLALSSAKNIVCLYNGTIGTVNPVNGGYFYVSAGALHWVGSNGTDTQIAPA